MRRRPCRPPEPARPAAPATFSGSDPRRWQRDLATYDEVSLGRVWPGVAVTLRAHARNVEKIFTILPGTDARRIRLRVEGAGPLSIAADGAIVAAAGDGRIRFTAPVAYQERGGERRPVAVAYALDGSTYGFRVSAYDHAAPLVIDPILQATYIGGADPDGVNAIAVDPASGDVLVAGYTYSSTSGRGVDGFVARFDPTLTTLRHSAYFGGSLGEEILGVAIHPATGDVYVAGYTASSDLPGTLQGAQRAYAGGDDGFVARFDPTLTQLLGSTYLGGSQPDRVVAIAIQPRTGEVVVAGQTVSNDFPGTNGGAQPSPADDEDFIRREGFVARLDPTLHALLQATYLGGVGPDFLHALAIQPSTGEVYVAGQTRAPDFPGVAGGANAAASPATGNTDGFVSRFDPSLTHLLQSAYVGASGSDDVFGIAIHPGSGDVYVVGWSDWADLPGAEGGAQPIMGGETDAFVTRLNGSLTELLGATYLGGIDNDYGNGIAIHPTRGDVYVTGETYSAGLPGTAQGAQPDRGGAVDGFIARFDAKLTQARPGDVPRRRRRRHSVRHRDPAGERRRARRGHDDLGRLSGNRRRLAARIRRRRRVPRRRRVRCADPGGAVGREQRVHCRRTHLVPGRTPVLGPGRLERSVAGPERRRRGRAARRGHGLLLVLRRCQRRARRQGPRCARDQRQHVGVLRSVDGRRVHDHRDRHGYGSDSDLLESVGGAPLRRRHGGVPASSDAGAAPSVRVETRSAAELYAMYASLAQAVSPKAAADSPCEAGGATLCLNQARFQVRVDWAVPDQGKSGRGNAVAVTPDTGYFWFFSDTNVELMVKVLDGRGVNGKFWVLYGALSNVQYTITVTDTQTQTVKKYENASGALASAADTLAF